MNKEEEFIEWLEFQFNFKMTDVSKLAVKSKLEQYAQQECRDAYNTARNNLPYLDFDDYWNNHKN